MSSKELRVDCPSCRARLAIDSLTAKVVTWQPPERFGGGSRPRVDEDDWSRAAQRVADRGSRSQDRFEAALAKEALRPRDLDELFAGGHKSFRPPVGESSGAPQPFTDAWYRSLARGWCEALTRRAGGANTHGPARVVVLGRSAEVFDLDLCDDSELDAALGAAADHELPSASVLPLTTAAATEERLLSRGWRPAGMAPVFMHDLSGLAPVSGDVRAVQAGDFEAWCRVASSDGASGVDRDSQVEQLRVEFGGSSWRLFLVRERGEAVAAAALLTEGGVAVLAHSVTLPDHRGRGHHRMLVAARLAAAAAAGARVAVLPPERTGVRPSAALALGFRLAYHESVWVPRPTA